MKSFKTLLLIAFASVLLSNTLAAQELPAYYSFGEISGTVAELNGKVVEALKADGFKIIGNYNPARRSDLSVIVFTSTDLENTVLKLYDRPALAAALKVGFRKVNDKVELSMVNPEYLFNAYLGSDIKTVEAQLQTISKLAVNTIKKADTKIDFTHFRV